MTYAAFLSAFLVIPIAILTRSAVKNGFRSWGLLAALSAIALLYTTLWDNFLVANRIWWYSPSQISGFLIGWVPLEEYVFFLLQPVLTGLWTWLVIRNFGKGSSSAVRKQALRWGTVGGSLILWLLASGTLIVGWPATRYLALILIWVLPPLALQFTYGADILWQRRWIVLLALIPPTLFLAAADILAISSGIWTINPSTSLPLLLFGVLPLEELLFFLVTNCLIVFTVILVWARRPATIRRTGDQILRSPQT